MPPGALCERSRPWVCGLAAAAAAAAGMPAFVANLPVLGGLLRGVSVRAVTRVLDDMAVAIDKVRSMATAGCAGE